MTTTRTIQVPGADDVPQPMCKQGHELHEQLIDADVYLLAEIAENTEYRLMKLKAREKGEEMIQEKIPPQVKTARLKVYHAAQAWFFHKNGTRGKNGTIICPACPVCNQIFNQRILSAPVTWGKFNGRAK